jgi:antitoxin ParD1/3/4
MSITLTLELEKLVEDKVKSGAYRSPNEVLKEALHMLDERQRKIEALRADLQTGLDQIERGEVVEGSVVFTELRKKYALQAS